MNIDRPLRSAALAAALTYAAACGDDHSNDSGSDTPADTHAFADGPDNEADGENGSLDSGTSDSGATDSGATDSGATDSGATDVVPTDMGQRPDTEDARSDVADPGDSPDLRGSDPPELTDLPELDAGELTEDSAADGGDDAIEVPAEIDPCAALTCGDGPCDGVAGTCACASDEWFDGRGCAPVEDCDLTDVCEACPVPRGPTLSVIAASEAITFDAAGAPLEVGVTLDLESGDPDTWTAGPRVSMDGLAGERVRVFARVPGCAVTFNAVFEVREGYPPAAEEPGSTAVSLAAASIVGWAASVVEVAFGADVADEWRVAENALGPAEGTSFDVVSLGRAGHIVLAFEPPIADRAGFDIAVFENSFSPTFLEVAVISVSSDGATFVEFDFASTGTAAVGAFGAIEPSTLGQLAGTYAQGWGTPFDLATLRQRVEVRTGLLDLEAVRYVRVDDVVGDGSQVDSFGRPIYDPYPTTGSAGFDLDAVAALNQGAEP